MLVSPERMSEGGAGMAGLQSPAPLGPVPPSAATVRDFVNTLDLDEGTDELETAAGLAGYLHSQGWLGAGVRATSSDLQLALRLRAGLRRAFELNHDGVEQPVSELHAALGELPLSLRWDGSRPVLAPHERGVRGALAQVAVAVQETIGSDTFRRLKICASDRCAWAYYDHSKNRSRQWCEYGCGNREKVRAYRQRRRVGT
jgi:predicted RNA-binding Zn ribbon-like protein